MFHIIQRDTRPSPLLAGGASLSSTETVPFPGSLKWVRRLLNPSLVHGEAFMSTRPSTDCIQKRHPMSTSNRIHFPLAPAAIRAGPSIDWKSSVLKRS